jgi:hypothetical protein
MSSSLLAYFAFRVTKYKLFKKIFLKTISLIKMKTVAF